MIEICRAVVAVHHIDELSQWKKCPNGNADCIATFEKNSAKFGSTPRGAGPAFLDLPKFSVLTRACVVKRSCVKTEVVV